MKAAGGGIYEDSFQNKIEFSADIEDDIEIHLAGSGNYIKLGKITSVNEYKIPEKMRKIWQVELAMLDTIDAICKSIISIIFCFTALFLALFAIKVLSRGMTI